MTAMITTAPRRLLLVVMLAAVAVGLMPGTPVSAHTGKQSYVYLEIFDTAIAGRVEYPLSDLNEVLGLDIPQDESGAVEAMEANRAAIEAYTAAHFSIGPADGSTTWSYTFGDIEALETFPQTYGIIQFEVDQRFDPPPRTFTVSYDGIIESDPDRYAFLLIATDWRSGTFNNEADEFLRYAAGSTTQIVDLDDTSWWKGFSGTVDLGVEHIRIGTDHIMFVLALVLPSVLLFTRQRGDDAARWHPAPSFGSSLWRIVKVATMFTVAHSITLALGGLGVIELPPRFVESVIAISIALAALHNLRPIFPNREWALAFGFGLFHGFGFAGLLADLGLDRSNRIQSLLGFNLGVEIGQIAIILMVFPTLFILRRTRYYIPILWAGSIGLAFLSLAWAVERVFEFDTKIDRLIDPIVEWPRILWILLLGVALASAIWAYERSKGRLLPVAQRGQLSPDPDEPERELVDA
jgi:hypothetical protein